MWLPKDERKLLASYFRRADKPDEPVTLGFKEVQNDMKALGWKESKSNANYDRKYINRIWNVDDLLKKRGFLGDLTHDAWEKTLFLTIQGYDLGRKYNSWWIRTSLWFAEYKDHWFWLIISFMGGIIGALVVNWLSK